MEEGQSLGSILNPSSANNNNNSRSAFKKRSSTGSEGDSSELSCKKIKMRDLASLFWSQGIEIHDLEPSGCEPVKNQPHLGKNEEAPEITEEPEAMRSDAFQAKTSGQNTGSQHQSASCLTSHNVDSDLSPMDLNTNALLSNDSVCGVADDKCRASPKKDHEPSSVSSRGIGLDLNADDASNRGGQNPLYPYKLSGYRKSTEASECGSSTGPLEENDSYRKWKEMKRNGFLSSAHGGIPMPAQSQQQPHRGKKRKNDSLKKKIELAKREQVHRFTKAAAPSGLLNGLNPGIINHVRNSKQVHSIIEALVRSEKLENSIQSRSGGHLKDGMDNNEKGKKLENVHDSVVSRPGVQFKAEHTNTSSASMQTKDYPMSFSMLNMSLISEHKCRGGHFEVAEKRVYDETSGTSHLTSDHEDKMLTLKLSSSITTTSENEELGNHASVSSLSAKAATVASQWLELLHQDIRGRLAALRRSRKRVQAVIQTELPFLMLKEFSSTRQNTPYFGQSPSNGCASTAVPDMHRARWTALFNQMDKTLTEEGKHLESWLNQVKEMQLQCERGLQSVDRQPSQPGSSESDPRSKVDTEKELALRAAAASIYSTCNFVKATEDVSCF